GPIRFETFSQIRESRDHQPLVRILHLDLSQVVQSSPGALVLVDELRLRHLEHSTNPAFGAKDSLINEPKLRVVVQSSDTVCYQLLRNVVLQEEHMRPPFHRIDQTD